MKGIQTNQPRNFDPSVVKGFGREWNTFTQKHLPESDRRVAFSVYFSMIDWNHFEHARVLDMGCGSGRWSAMVAPRVRELVAADASEIALAVARKNLSAHNVSFVQCTPDTIPFPDAYFDLIICLGVLHAVPYPLDAIESLAGKLKPGGTLLLYTLYAFDNRPKWFRALWQLSNIGRRGISRLPYPLRLAMSQIIAACIYWPLARAAKYFPARDSWPLRYYAHQSFYTMRTDALDRFGTRMENRLTRDQISQALTSAGLSDIKFRESAPYWVVSAKQPKRSLVRNSQGVNTSGQRFSEGSL